MPLSEARQEALIHAGIKDDYYLRVMRSQFTSLVQQTLGANVLIQWKNELTVLSDMLYFLLTTVQGSQTLGEEYASIIQVDSAKTKIPSKFQRILLMLMTSSPYVITKSLQKFEQIIEKTNALSKLSKKRWLIFVKLLNQLTPVVQQLHVALFYMEGMYSSISLRFTRIRHVLIRPPSAGEHDPITFRWLAVMATVNAVVKIASLIYAVKQDLQDVSTALLDDHDSQDSPERSCMALRIKRKCSLCLDTMSHTSVTMCGHLFCWKCIISWCTVKPECPSCRHSCPPSKIVYLNHYFVS